jgi:Protein of unknown function (DUF2489)
MERPWQITNEEEWFRSCKEVVDVARRMLDGSVGIVEGARSLVALSSRVRAEEDPDFLVFVAIDSETDHFPIGDVRGHWNRDALAREDATRSQFEEESKQEAQDACRKLISKYDNAA